METATVQQVLDDALFHLRVSRKEAARELQAAVKIGQAIRGQRIRDMRDLDEARREKQEWLQRTIEMLEALVTTPAWAEQFNDFVPTILPEYAEFGMFVDVFEEEMRHRLGRLNGFLKSLNDVLEPLPLQRPPTAPLVAAAADPDARPVEPAEPAAAAAAAPRQPHPEMVDPRLAKPEINMQQVNVQSPSSSSYAAQAPSATLAQAQASKPQPQQQVQQQMTVAASILTDPHPPARVPGGASRGALILRASDDGAAEGIAQFLERLGLSLRAIDRREAGGPSLIDELNDPAGPARFVLMLTDPNSANPTPEDLFDLGCCVGRMGPDRVFALHRGGEAGTDRFGIAHIPFDGSEGWQLTLARHLKKAGVQVDLNRLV